MSAKIASNVSVNAAYLHVSAAIKPGATSANHLWNAREKAASKNIAKIALMEKIVTWSVAMFAKDAFVPTVDTWSLAKLVSSALAQPASNIKRR